MRDKLELVLRTLNKITLSGRDNLDMMLGAMLMIEQIIGEQQNTKEAENNA